jgi:hypothetical protein
VRGRSDDTGYERLARRLVAELDDRESWQRGINALLASLPELVSSARRELDDESLLALLRALVAFVGRTGQQTEELKERLFELAEEVGVHVLPVHYASPVPDTRALPASTWERRIDLEGVRIDLEALLRLLEHLDPFLRELDRVPARAAAGGAFHWENGQLNRTDASIYYALVRDLRPRLVLEVGGGYSTLVACAAAVRNGETQVVCIDPEPRVGLEGLPGLTRLVRARVQDVSLDEEIGRLGRGDVLFVDSSHVSRIGSDVNRLVLEVLPRLAPGALAHFHDVFLPWEYPEEWVRRQHFWNEQYLLHAFLLFNDAFEVLWASNLVATEAPDALRAAIGPAPDGNVMGSSLWLRRRG